MPDPKLFFDRSSTGRSNRSINVTDRLFATSYSLFASLQAAYDAANQQIQFNAGSPNQTFDANGNLTSETGATGTTSYTWDARNRLVSRSGPGINEQFSYDALGRRISKTINGVTTSYLYDGNDIVQEIGGSAVAASYVRSLNIDEPFARQTSAGNEFYHVDALGSTLDLTNQAGAVQVNYQYEAFGKTTVTGTSSNPFQYTGRENDGTGLYYYRARYYSTSLHRFASEDPTGFVGGPNKFSYTLNNPIRFTDPLGLKEKDAMQANVDDPTVNPYCFLPFVECSDPKEFVVPPLMPGTTTPDFPGPDPTKPPREGMEWRGNGPPGSNEGAWYDPKTRESFHPDLNNMKEGPHWDYVNKDTGQRGRIFPDGTFMPK